MHCNTMTQQTHSFLFFPRCIFRKDILGKGIARPPKVSDANIERSMRTTFLQICNLNTILTRYTTLSSSFLALFYWHNLNRWSNYLILLHHDMPCYVAVLRYYIFVIIIVFRGWNEICWDEIYLWRDKIWDNQAWNYLLNGVWIDEAMFRSQPNG